MEDSILNSTKNSLEIPENETAFDLSVILNINAAFSVSNQLGVTPAGFHVEDAETKWSDLALSQEQLSMLQSYISLKVRRVFDPPTTSFLLDVFKEQIEELECRMSMIRENLIPIPEVVDELAGW